MNTRQKYKQFLSTVEEAEPTEEEKAVFEAYRNGDPEYQPEIPFDELVKELGIEL